MTFSNNRIYLSFGPLHFLTVIIRHVDINNDGCAAVSTFLSLAMWFCDDEQVVDVGIICTWRIVGNLHTWLMSPEWVHCGCTQWYCTSNSCSHNAPVHLSASAGGRWSANGKKSINSCRLRDSHSIIDEQIAVIRKESKTRTDIIFIVPLHLRSIDYILVGDTIFRQTFVCCVCVLRQRRIVCRSDSLDLCTRRTHVCVCVCSVCPI